MAISRRDFLKYCTASAVALGLSRTDLLRIEDLLANSSAPTVLWLQGASCDGCTSSFLNRISSSSPATAADVLTNSINLVYQANLMAMAGQDAVDAALQARDSGGYILAVEGAVPTAFGGRACFAWNNGGVDVTFQQVVTDLAAHASTIISIGTCSSFGGIPALSSNTGMESVSSATGKSTVNVAGCPPHPDWIVYAIAQLLAGNTMTLDSYSRPTAIYGQTVHSRCPRYVVNYRSSYNCLFQTGCRGPAAYCNCPTTKWNNAVNWCVNANAPCIACTEANFPGITPFNTMIYNHQGTTNLNCNSCHDD